MIFSNPTAITSAITNHFHTNYFTMKTPQFTTPQELDDFVSSLEKKEGWGKALQFRTRYLQKTTPDFRKQYLKKFYSTEIWQAFQENTFLAYVSNVSRSGMSRHIVLLLPYVDNEGKPQVLNCSYILTDFLGMKASPDWRGVVVKGCGMDMIFWLIEYMLDAFDLPKSTGTCTQRASYYLHL